MILFWILFWILRHALAIGITLQLIDKWNELVLRRVIVVPFQKYTVTKRGKMQYVAPNLFRMYLKST